MSANNGGNDGAGGGPSDSGPGGGGGLGGFFNITPAQIIQHLAMRVKSYAKDAGTSCSMPVDRGGGKREDGCDSLTVGIRCEGCSRRICVGHTFWNTAGAKLLPWCPFCVVSLNEDLFDGEDEDDDEE